jgi:hypothetical protein
MQSLPQRIFFIEKALRFYIPLAVLAAPMGHRRLPAFGDK